jgi:hypothetical protein
MTNGKIVKILYGVSFAVHLCAYFYIANIEPIAWLARIAAHLLSMYESIGFHWSQEVAYLLSSGMIFGIVLNAVRRTVEGIVLGWPRFKDHDKYTFFWLWLRCVFYVGLVFLGIGAWGSNESRRLVGLYALDASYEFRGIMNVFSIVLYSFILGTVVNTIDDAISATISILKE